MKSKENIIDEYEKYCISEYNKLKRIKSDNTISGVMEVISNFSDSLQKLDDRYIKHIHHLLKDYDGDKQAVANELREIAMKHIKKLGEWVK